MMAVGIGRKSRIVLLGPPGAGKGTQALRLADEFGVPHISTGEIMRRAIDVKTDLGIAAKEYVDRGELVPDQLVVDIVEARIAEPDCAMGFLLDGFPRTVMQAAALVEHLEKQGCPLTHILDLQVPEEEILERIRKRSTEAARTDDSHEVAKNRLRVYREQTAPVKAFFERSFKVVDVSGLGSIDEVFGRLKNLVG